MPLRWSGFGKGKNDAETGSSSGRRRFRTPSPTPSSSPEPTAPASFELTPPGAEIARRDRVYVSKEDCQWYWDHAVPLPWPDVKLPEHWHLNPQRIPVPPMPTSERAWDLEVELRRLPAELRNDPAYAARSSNWDAWFSGEHSLRRQSLYTRAPTPPSGDWSPPPHTWRRDAPPVPRNLRMGSPPPPPPAVKMEVEEELEAAKEASRKTLAKDEAKRWAKVLDAVAREQEEALQAQQATVLEEPQPWWQAMDVDLPPAPPLPAGLQGQRWTFNGGVWEVERAPPLPEEEQEQPPTPSTAVPPRGGPPAHLWQQPDYVILDDE